MGVVVDSVYTNLVSLGRRNPTCPWAVVVSSTAPTGQWSWTGHLVGAPYRARLDSSAAIVFSGKNSRNR